jgi:hypothetical protein
MEQNKEIRVLLTEETFTQVCKMGFLKYQSPTIGRTDVHFYKQDILNLSKGYIITKEISGYEGEQSIFKFALKDIGFEMIREIVKRSPIYYELSNSI